MGSSTVVRKFSETGSKTQALWRKRREFVSSGPYHYSSVFAERGRGALLWDAEGSRYIDFAGGIGALNVGHCHPWVVKAIQEQAKKLIHTCYSVALYEDYHKVCEKLANAMPGKFSKKAALFNSGAEAVENAVKLARLYTRRPAVIAFENSFHGRTYMAMTLTGKEKPYKTGLGPFVPEVYHAPYPYPYRPPEGVAPEKTGQYALAVLEHMLETQVSAEKTAAVIVEPVLGEGGFVVPPPDFLPGLRKICDKHGIVLIVDEIQTGFGRTGKMFACEHSGVMPDLMTVAKSLAAGLPLSGVVGRAEIMDSAAPGGIGGTYGGNPVACAAALAVFEIFEKERLVKKAEKTGAAVRKAFLEFQREFPVVGEVRGLGAMMAMEMTADRKTKEPLAAEKMKAFLAQCQESGLIVLKSGLYSNVIRFLAPLVISDSELDEGLGILRESLKNHC